MIKVILLTGVLLIAVIFYTRFRVEMLEPLEKLQIAYGTYIPVDLMIASWIALGCKIALLVEAVIFIVKVF